jgi:hypothetical protein
MTYRSRLYPWSVVNLLPDMQRLTVAQFRRRNDAEEHLKLIQRQNPTATYEIAFDSMQEPLTPASN